MFYYDPTMLLIIPALILSLYAQAKVNSNFKKYSKVYNQRGITGAEVARKILSDASINDVTIDHAPDNNLGDHYDPRNKVIRLSDEVFGSTSVAAAGIAAHECGHAIQEARGYVPNKLRMSFVPLANLGSMAAIPLFFIGILLSIGFLQTLGIAFFSLTTLFYLITLPVEFNASSRALKILASDNYLAPDEVNGARQVLSAAALTYLAAALMSLLQLLRLILISRRD